jgi:hypothetical protein
MGSRLHLCPARLFGHAATATALADELHAAIERVGSAEQASDRLVRPIRRAARELAELGAALADAAGAAERAEQVAADRFERLSRISWPDRR